MQRRWRRGCLCWQKPLEHDLSCWRPHWRSKAGLLVLSKTLWCLHQACILDACTPANHLIAGPRDIRRKANQQVHAILGKSLSQGRHMLHFLMHEVINRALPVCFLCEEVKSFPRTLAATLYITRLERKCKETMRKQAYGIGKRMRFLKFETRWQRRMSAYPTPADQQRCNES